MLEPIVKTFSQQWVLLGTIGIVARIIICTSSLIVEHSIKVVLALSVTPESVEVLRISDETAIQQQINSVVDIFPAENYTPPTFQDRSRNANRGRSYYRGGHNNRRGRRH